MNKLSIIIPVYNEAKTIHLILQKVINITLLENTSFEVIIVDDCATDTTIEAVNNFIQQHSNQQITFLKHTVNKGKGAALHTVLKQHKAIILYCKMPIWNTTPMSIIYY